MLLHYIFEFFLDISVFITLLLLARHLFEESILIDKKNIILCIVLEICTELCDMLLKVWPNLVLRSANTVLVLVILLRLFMRGDKGRLKKRLRAMVDVFIIFMLSVSLYLVAVFLMLTPELIMEDSLDYSQNDKVLFFGGAIYIFFGLSMVRPLIRKGICLNLRFRDRFLLGFLSMLIAVAADLFALAFFEGNYKGMPVGFRYTLFVCLSVFYLGTPRIIVQNNLSSYFEMGQKHQQEMLLLELKHFEQYKEAQEETRRFRHDMINHLMTLQMLQSNDKQEEAKKYVDELLGEVTSLSPKVVTGCDMLDCIISSKIERMEQLDIPYEMDGVLDYGLSMSPVDLCAIFANALDNAIEASEKVEKQQRKIALRMKRTAAFYVITIKNKMAMGEKIKDRLGHQRFTTKGTKEFHGYGIDIIKKTVKKYGGETTIEFEEDFFLLTIMLPVER